ncbi:MAG: hypothetical protein F4018_08125 [Acidobacteria bacterium]|nr:hypothetical protein [Acidobacteriota bacterium]
MRACSGSGSASTPTRSCSGVSSRSNCSESERDPAMLRVLIVLHRWVGVALCLLFLLWFPSGIGMMYWGFPSVTEADRLARAPALDAGQVTLTPQAAARTLRLDPRRPDRMRLTTVDGRPAYRGGRGGGRVVYADTGRVQGDVSANMRDRAAEAWTGQRVRDGVVESVIEVDQWTVQGALRNRRPLWKYSWPNGEQLYIGDTGEVLQYTTTASRLGAWVSAIPHWIYFTAIRQHQTVWIRFVIWTSGIGTVLAIIGLVVAVARYSPGRRYRQDGRPARLPYRGQQRWHAILGLIFGVATATWAFSGMLSLDPFPSATPRGPAGRGPDLAEALRGEVALDDFAALSPGDLLARHPDLEVKAVELTAFDGRPLYAARLGDGATVMFGIDGRRVDRFDHDEIARIVRRVAPDAGAVETRILDRYDRYYLDRRRARPLPVILAQLHDDAATRYYIDPATGRVVGQYSNRRWVSRWLYSGLHSLNFPWLYNNRPLWDIVVITFMLGGTALCVTSLVLSWRVVGQTLRQRLSSRVGGP